MQNVAIKISGLRKTYENGFEALVDIDLEIKRGRYSHFWVPMARVRRPLLVRFAVSFSRVLA